MINQGSVGGSVDILGAHAIIEAETVGQWGADAGHPLFWRSRGSVGSIPTCSSFFSASLTLASRYRIIEVDDKKPICFAFVCRRS